MPTGSIDLPELAKRLASRTRTRSEATVQADVRTLLLYGGLNLEDSQVVALEVPAGDRRRIDVEVGFTVIEVKKDLRAGNGSVMTDAVVQLTGYVRDQSVRLAQRYVGVLTDGADWYLYYLTPGETLVEASTFHVVPARPDVEGLLIWLEGVLATRRSITPTPREISVRLGSSSATHGLERANIAALYAECRDRPSVQLKRELWARLLTAALGTHFHDDDDLFVEHTYLVITAGLIAHAVLGFSMGDPTYSPASLVTGRLFAQAQITGVVESDFFDWVIEAQGGDSFVATLARRLSRFSWGEVEHDVLKVLYESVIEAKQRHDLGEYYTPDWLAERVVEEVIESPLEQRVLDPACGSGTFLFYAVRRYLAAADADGVSIDAGVAGVVTHVYGVDLHPVAVTLARVTYLLAIGRERLSNPDRGPFAVPVYLGDSLQLRHDDNLLAAGGITIYTSDGAELFDRELSFPARVIADVGRFDHLVDELANRARNRASSAIPTLNVIFSRYAIDPDDQPILTDTFAALCHLHDQGRNHVWGYYVRNLARPRWLSDDDNRVDVLIGNPPWLAYRYMPADLQQRFKKLSVERKLWAGAQLVTHQDISGLFVARTVELYLRVAGRFGFVMPAACLTRKQFAGFRGGVYPSAQRPVDVQFETPWDMTEIEPPMFPVPSCVIFGIHAPTEATPLGHLVDKWSGTLPSRDIDLGRAGPLLSIAEDEEIPDVTTANASPYRSAFFQGAFVVPRVLLVVEPASVGPLGVGSGRVAIRSARSTQEKQPWRDLPQMTGAVESEFVHRLYFGATILPYRCLAPELAVIPWTNGRMLEPSDEELDRYPGLAEWWRKANELWVDNRRDYTKISLAGRLEYKNGISVQFPIARQRVVYSASGATLTAARLDDPRGLVDKKLYWGAVGSIDEGRYLTAVLNSVVVQDLIGSLQSRGQFGRRDFDKVVFAAAFPKFVPTNPIHTQLAAAAARAEAIAAGVSVAGTRFPRARTKVRAALIDDGVHGEIEALVSELFP